MKEHPILFKSDMIKAILDGRKTQTRRVIKKAAAATLVMTINNRSDQWGIMSDKIGTFCAPAQPGHHVQYDDVFCPYGVPGDRLAQRPTKAGWYDVRWEPRDKWERIWLWEGGKCWGRDRSDDPEAVDQDIIDPDKIEWKTPGDRLWVRESYHLKSIGDDFIELIYAADGTGKSCYIDDPCAEDEKRAMEILSRDNERDFLGYHPSIYMPRWASRITLEVLSVRVERVQEISGEDCCKEGAITLTELNQRIKRADDTPFHEQNAREARRVFRNLWDSINAARGYGWDKNPFCWVVEFKLAAKEGK